jgi:hypothetical protein
MAGIWWLIPMEKRCGSPFLIVTKEKLMTNHRDTPTFDIRITKVVTFYDSEGTVVKSYSPGDVVKATADAGHYFVTSMGGIYTHEAVRV